MVQEIKINDDYTLQFSDMTSSEYVECTCQLKDIKKEDFKTESEYKTAYKLNDIDFAKSIANKIFLVNGKKQDVESLPPYLFGAIKDLVNGYIYDINSKKAWDLKGGEKKLEEEQKKRSISKASKKKKENSK